jgi:hypothetical protein
MKLLILILFLIIIYYLFLKKECMSDAELNEKSNELYKKLPFVKSKSYTSVKNRIPWIDSVIYYDVNQKTNISSMDDIKDIIRPK